MGRKKVDRSDKIRKSLETTKPHRERLIEKEKRKEITVSALIRELLEKHFEERN